MANNSKIEWTQRTWNVVTGCDKVSPGCGLARPNSNDGELGLTGGCYAMTMARRLKAMGQAKYQNDGDPRTSGPGFGVTMHPDSVTAPLEWSKPSKVFVNSMSDLFHDKIDAYFIAQVFAVMAATPQHTYQLLTKRHGRMRSLLSSEEFRWATKDAYAQLHLDGLIPGQPLAINAWPLPNLWLGVSAEDQHWANIRIPALLETPAAVRWISAEPLLGPIDLTRISRPSGHQPELVWDVLGRRYGVPGLWQAPMKPDAGLNWVVTGGESGPGARPAHPDWFRSIRDQCKDTGVAYLHKQHGAYTWQLSGPYRAPDLYVNAETGDALVEADVPNTGTWKGVWRVGKKAAGRELDGVTHDGFPQPVEVAS